MDHMFSFCDKLKKLNIINFNTSKVINMSHMFSGCWELIDLDLTNFEINKEIDIIICFLYAIMI